MFTDTDPDVLKESYGTLHLCKYPGPNGIVIIDAKWITAVVGMVPFTYTHGERNYLEGKQYFAVEKMSGVLIPKHDADDPDDDED
jgi:hypothetical protein